MVPPSCLVLRKFFESWGLGPDLCAGAERGVVRRGVFWRGICQVGRL